MTETPAGDVAVSPSISIVIPVRDGMPFIKDALASVVADKSPNLEVIIAENFSKDGTPGWLATIDDPRVRVIPASEPLSAGANWTRACEAATGTWLKVLCADDFLPDGALSRQLAAAERSPGVVLVASRRRVVSDSGVTVLRRHGLHGFIGRIGGVTAARRAILSGSNPFGEPSSVLFKRSALVSSLPFTEDHPYLTDLDMYIKILGKGDFLGLKSIDGAFRLSASSWSAKIGNNQLEQHRSWIDHLTRSGGLRAGWTSRILMAARLRAHFAARRIITTVVARHPLYATRGRDL